MIRTRKQEFEKLKSLCNSLDLDWQLFDMEAYGYEDIKKQIYKYVGLKDKQMQEEEYLAWEGLAQAFDQTAFEERVVIPEGYLPNVQFVNCLVMQFKPRDFDFALRVLLHKFKGNFMEKTEKILEANKSTLSKHRVLWLMGHRKVTDLMLTELEKHQIRPKVLRNSYLRRDFAHYFNGHLYPISKQTFRELKTKQSVKELKQEEKIIAKLYA